MPKELAWTLVEVIYLIILIMSFIYFSKHFNILKFFLKIDLIKLIIFL